MKAAIKTNLWLNISFIVCYLIGYWSTVLANLSFFKSMAFGVSNNDVGEGWIFGWNFILFGWILYVPTILTCLIGIILVFIGIVYSCLAFRYFNERTWIALLGNATLMIMILVAIFIVFIRVFDGGNATKGMFCILMLVGIDLVVQLFLLIRRSDALEN